jgi:hypothetical protein
MIHTINIHNVKSVLVGEAVRNEINDDVHNYHHVYFVRQIVFTDHKGETVTLNVFGDSESDIELFIVKS